jgi:hypothetical protein
MKNLFLIPTDKPSKLHLIEDTLTITSDYKNSVCDGEVNIYITSDEEIKEGVNQWYLDKFLNKPRNSSGSQYGEKQDVIILTTDQDLIKDGVQAIDDEFLEWFVKNPSCEEVEVEQEKAIGYVGDRQRTFYGKYKIIIPKEEREQETLEEAALRLSKDAYKKHSVKDGKLSLDEQIQRSGGFIVGFKEGMINGAKWHKKNSYSEEDMRQAIFTSFLLGVDRGNYSKELEDKLIEQFKKK